MKVGRVTLSDRVSDGVYEDKSGPEIERVISDLFAESIEFISVVLPDEKEMIEEALRNLVQDEGCPLVVTTGGTGPSKRDVTPEATKAVIEKELPGFGELMRMESYRIVKTAILSRATAGILGKSLIVNLPGSPRSIGECLPLLVPAIAEALDHIADFRPKLKS